MSSSSDEELRALAFADPVAMKDLGNAAYRDGDLALARKRYLLAAEAGNIDALNNLGVLSRKEGDLEQAREWIMKALEREERDYFQHNMGLIAYDQKLLEETEEWWSRAADSGHKEAIYNLGVLYKEVGEFQSATNWFRQTVKLEDDNFWKATHNLIDIVKNPACPENILEMLAVDSGSAFSDSPVRIGIAERKDCPESIVEILSNDLDFKVRLIIAQREDCPERIVEKLASDKSKRVRDAIAKRNNLPKKIKEDLRKQGFESAEAILADKSGEELTYEEINRVKVVHERANLVKSITSSSTLLALSEDSSTNVRLEVAANVNTPDEALKKILEMCQGEYWTGVNATIVYRVINNPNSNEKTLKLAANMANGSNLALFFERNPEISFDLFLHILNFMNTSQSFKQMVKRNFKMRSKEFSEEHWQAVASHENPMVRALVASSINAPKEFYELLALDDNIIVRDALMANKKAPETARAAAALLA